MITIDGLDMKIMIDNCLVKMSETKWLVLPMVVMTTME